MKKLGSSTFPKTQGILSNMQCDAIFSLVSHIIMGMHKLHFSTLWYGKKKNSTTFMTDQKQNSDQPRLIATWLSVFPIFYILWFLAGFNFVLEQLAIVNKSQ